MSFWRRIFPKKASLNYWPGHGYFVAVRGTDGRIGLVFNNGEPLSALERNISDERLVLNKLRNADPRVEFFMAEMVLRKCSL